MQFEKRHSYNRWINILAIAVPVIVALLLGIRQKVDLGPWTKTLPHINGGINTLTAILLIIGRVYIAKGQIEKHRKVMTSAFVLGTLFLISYVIYHVSNDSTRFGGDILIVRYVYYFLLISHIILSVVVVWYVLRAIYYGWTGQITEHKKVVKYAFPIWLYVSVTGVIVYLMISPYYS